MQWRTMDNQFLQSSCREIQAAWQVQVCELPQVSFFWKHSEKMKRRNVTIKFPYYLWDIRRIENSTRNHVVPTKNGRETVRGHPVKPLHSVNNELLFYLSFARVSDWLIGQNFSANSLHLEANALFLLVKSSACRASQNFQVMHFLLKAT